MTIKLVKIIGLYLLPQHFLSRVGGIVATCRWPRVKNRILRRFIKRYNVNMAEAIRENPEDYIHFQDFFSRKLKPGLRRISPDPNEICSPVDGNISEFGSIDEGKLIQAKGKLFRVHNLLGLDEQDPLTQHFKNGEFMTIYLAPPDYHRIHIPMNGHLIKSIYVPGRLFSVNPTSVKIVDGLFARNERLVAIFSTTMGPVAVIMVGAFLVASIATVWDGLITPPGGSCLLSKDFNIDDPNYYFEKGAEIGHFNLGSTVILLFGKDAINWSTLAVGGTIKLGEKIASRVR